MYNFYKRCVVLWQTKSFSILFFLASYYNFLVFCRCISALKARLWPPLNRPIGSLPANRERSNNSWVCLGSRRLRGSSQYKVRRMRNWITAANRLQAYYSLDIFLCLIVKFGREGGGVASLLISPTKENSKCIPVSRLASFLAYGTWQSLKTSFHCFTSKKTDHKNWTVRK